MFNELGLKNEILKVQKIKENMNNKDDQFYVKNIDYII